MDKPKDPKITMRSIHKEEFERAGWQVTDEDVDDVLEGIKEPFFKDIIENEKLGNLSVEQVRMFVNSIVDKALTEEEAEELRIDLRAKINQVVAFHEGTLDPIEALKLQEGIQAEIGKKKNQN